MARSRGSHVMTPTAAKIHVVTALTLLLAGCASTPPPRDRLADAERAVERADEVRADELAPVDADFARRQLAAAETAFEARDYERAERLAIQAELNADLAAAKARAASARAEVARQSDENAELRRELLGEGDGR